MKTKNFAIFGLFANGEFIDAGSMNEVIDMAQSHAGKSPNIRYSISWMVFSEEDDNTEITEGVKVLSYTNINGEIYVTN